MRSRFRRFIRLPIAWRIMPRLQQPGQWHRPKNPNGPVCFLMSAHNAWITRHAARANRVMRTRPLRRSRYQRTTRREHFWNFLGACGVYMVSKSKAQKRKGPFHEPKIDRRAEGTVRMPVNPAVRDVPGRSRAPHAEHTMPHARRSERDHACAPAIDRPHQDC